MVKKIWLFMTVFMVVVGFTACGAPPAPLEALSLDNEKPLPEAAGYEKNLDGLIAYLKESQVITGEGLQMSYDFIGAENGMKFSFTFMEAGVSCELYEFNGEDLNATAEEVLSSVEEKGFFMALDKEVRAVLSEDRRFMMIYVCAKSDEQDKALESRAHEAFQKFV